jgi:pimeloyl-ACP methyl ester carboxylesterase
VAWPLLSVPVQAFGPYPAPVVRDYGRQSLPNRVWTLWSLWGDPSLGTEVEGATDAIREAGLPVAVAHADDDRSVGPANARAWRDRLPHAQDIDVPVGGHQFLLKVGFGSLVPWLRGVQVGGHG